MNIEEWRVIIPHNNMVSVRSHKQKIIFPAGKKPKSISKGEEEGLSVLFSKRHDTYKIRHPQVIKCSNTLNVHTRADKTCENRKTGFTNNFMTWWHNVGEKIVLGWGCRIADYVKEATAHLWSRQQLNTEGRARDTSDLQRKQDQSRRPPNERTKHKKCETFRTREKQLTG